MIERKDGHETDEHYLTSEMGCAATTAQSHLGCKGDLTMPLQETGTEQMPRRSMQTACVNAVASTCGDGGTSPCDHLGSQKLETSQEDDLLLDRPRRQGQKMTYRENVEGEDIWPSSPENSSVRCFVENVERIAAPVNKQADGGEKMPGNVQMKAAHCGAVDRQNMWRPMSQRSRLEWQVLVGKSNQLRKYSEIAHMRPEGRHQGGTMADIWIITPRPNACCQNMKHKVLKRWDALAI